jgi:hypothetical protein
MTSRRKLLSCCLLVLGGMTSVWARPEPPDALAAAGQIMVVTTPDWNAVEGTLRRYERSPANPGWQEVGDPITVVIGKTGMAWGAGLPPSNDPRLRASSDPVKKEGDGKSPAGIFGLSAAFGYAAQAKSGWRMPYVPLSPTVECVDDPASKSYNHIVDNRSLAPDWKSSEHMLRPDDLYRWGLVVDHNADPVVPGAGSCIFMHIWEGPGRGTVGCTAMPGAQLESLLSWLDPAKKPLLVQLPLPLYQRLRKLWRLPALADPAP